MAPVDFNPALHPPVGAQRPRPVAPPSGGAGFAAALDGVTFSKHAAQRVERRGLELTPDALQRLDGAVAKAAAKGSRDAMVLVDDVAFVVSVANRTVLTAVGRDQLKDQVFTNIDSAVIG